MISFQKQFPNTSSGHVQCSIDNIAEISVKNKKSLLPESENRKKIHIFSGKNCPKKSSIHEERAFDEMTRTFRLKKKKNYASNSDQKEKKILPQNIFPKVFVWTLRMQFWQQNRKTFATKWKDFRTKSGA